jgi:hypothetical protein
MATLGAILQKLLAAIAGNPESASSTGSTADPANTSSSANSASPVDSASSGASIAGQASAAIDQFRSVGKWIITSFAAVATLLLAGVQLTSLGSVHGWHLLAAIAGLGAAVIAALTAITKLTSLLQPNVSTEDDAVKEAGQGGLLTDFIRGHESLFFPPGINDAADLQAKYHDARAARSLTKRPSSYSETHYKDLRRSLVNLVWMSSYENAKRRFDDSRRTAVGAALVVAIGATLYAWAATTPSAGTGADTSSAAVEPAPVEVTVKLTRVGQAAFSSILSKKCVEAAGSSGIPAIALSADTSQTTVVLIPTQGTCTAPTRISIPLSEGFATATSVRPAVSPSSSQVKR